MPGSGWVRSPKRLWMGTRVRGAVADATWSPAAIAPRSPCSGANKAPMVASAAVRISAVGRSAASTPVWLVISPTRLPATSCRS